MDNNINYQLQLDKIISSLDGKKPSLLLHACCAPCSSYCLEYLKNFFEITLYFYNPNISCEEEWKKRYNELKRLVNDMNLDIAVICPPYNPQEFMKQVIGYENCPEGGDRCSICYALRLKSACNYAEENGFDYYCSTLSISPHKNVKKLNSIGQALAKDKTVKFLPNDFKKKGGYLRSIELSKEYNLYRQDFCGCMYSRQAKV
ncbi:MAG: epoxyqueuosine reductase QueH [Clostridia bacterium]|nr:epoxyqueuosine reductase QueH [Clostridia bacterium]